MVASVKKPEQKEKVVSGDFSVNLNYADFAHMMTIYHGPQDEGQMEWMQANDEQTRAKMCELMREGWPQSEALTESLLLNDGAWKRADIAKVGIEAVGLDMGWLPASE